MKYKQVSRSDTKSNSRIWFKEPAKNFIEGTLENPAKVNQSGELGELSEWITALPIGNGRLGGTVFGGVQEDLIKLNDRITSYNVCYTKLLRIPVSKFYNFDLFHVLFVHTNVWLSLGCSPSY